MSEIQFRGTTIIGVKRDGKTAIAGDGQVTFGENVIMKSNASKVRRIYNDSVIIGFAGAVADAFSLCEKLEKMLQKFNGNLMRSAIELALLWRNDKLGRQLNALAIIANKDEMLLVSGNGEVMTPEEGLFAIGSGGFYAMSAGRALIRNTNLSAKEIAYKSIQIAGEICVYTNDHITVEEI